MRHLAPALRMKGKGFSSPGILGMLQTWEFPKKSEDEEHRILGSTLGPPVDGNSKVQSLMLTVRGYGPQRAI